MRFYLLLLLATPTLFAQTGIDVKAMDASVKPCDDFYQYACGNWRKSNPIPADQSRWSRFNQLYEQNRVVLRQIAEKLANPANQHTPNEKKVGEFYAACMDTKAIEAKGLGAIQPDLDLIAKLTDKKQLAGLVAELHMQGVPALFRFSAEQDAKDATQVIASVGQGGLSLPDRDYYTRTDPKSVETREKYEAHLRRMFELLGHSPAQAKNDAATVLRIETDLAKASLTRLALRDPYKRYHKLPTASLTTYTPDFDWPIYLADVHVSVPSLNIGMPDFLKSLETTLTTDSLADLRTYLTWHVLHDAAPMMPARFDEENFNFFGHTLTGAKEQQARWKRCVQATDRALGEALGQVYVEQTFGQEGKARTLKMVTEIETQMAKDIDSLAWMSDATKKAALEKLKTVANKIGFPEKWRDYENFQVVRGDAIGNEMRSAEFEHRRTLNKIGKPVDKMEWGMTPPTVNAYYNPPQNNINFPAGILQPPFYYKGGDEAANYGAIGAVVGHELTHGFDDQGSQYDGQGNLRNWWTAEDRKKFVERTDCVAEEYGNFVAVAGVKQNGKLTLGENAADNGGLRLAYMALEDALEKGEVSKAKLGGFTPEQRFFIAWGQVWCENRTDESARLAAYTDPHSAGHFRANGVLVNMPEFQQAFGCQAGDNMISKNACRVW
ncbi:MAG TPA: M13 family peptidase [Solibacterales bacterium]|nr:M13 family peptidase [Bryobacterales bacterium]